MMFTNGRFASNGGCKYCKHQFVDGRIRWTCVDFRCTEGNR